MLSLALTLFLAADPPLPAKLTLAIGEQRVFHIPGIQRIAVSSASTYDVKTIGNDRVFLEGAEEGRTTLLVWTTRGRLSMELTVVPRHAPPAAAVKGEKVRADRLNADGGATRGQVEIFEIPEQLFDLREVPSDAGLVFEGRTAEGAKRIITLTPRR